MWKLKTYPFQPYIFVKWQKIALILVEPYPVYVYEHLCLVSRSKSTLGRERDVEQKQHYTHTDCLNQASLRCGDSFESGDGDMVQMIWTLK